MIGTHFDINHDGVIDYHDCPYTPGSEKAKLWWRQVEDYSRSHVSAKVKREHPSATGEFNGQPVIEGQVGPGAAKFNLLVNKLILEKGLSHQSAIRLAGKIKHAKYGR